MLGVPVSDATPWDQIEKGGTVVSRCLPIGSVWRRQAT